jgi:hypothetical protein
MEAESLRAAAEGLWGSSGGGLGSGGTISPTPAQPAASSANDILGMPPLPSGMIGGDLLASLRLDGEPPPPR